MLVIRSGDCRNPIPYVHDEIRAYVHIIITR